MDERRKLLAKISACQFAQVELVQFLDTHPNCVEAMQVLNMHRANAMKLKEEYECKFGPLSNPKGNGRRWEWIDDPWPWDYQSASQCCPFPRGTAGAKRGKGVCR